MYYPFRAYLSGGVGGTGDTPRIQNWLWWQTSCPTTQVHISITISNTRIFYVYRHLPIKNENSKLIANRSVTSLVSITANSTMPNSGTSTQTLISSNERSDSTHHLFLGFLLIKSDHVTYSGELTFFCTSKTIGGKHILVCFNLLFGKFSLILTK